MQLVQFWQNFQTSLVLLIANCTRHRMIILSITIDCRRASTVLLSYKSYYKVSPKVFLLKFSSIMLRHSNYYKRIFPLVIIWMSEHYAEPSVKYMDQGWTRVYIVYWKTSKTRPWWTTILVKYKIFYSWEFKIAYNRMKEHNCIRIVKLIITHTLQGIWIPTKASMHFFGGHPV